MLRDLRSKLRTRHSRISSCDHTEFYALTKQFFAFLNSQSVLKAVISELLGRNPSSVKEAQTVGESSQVYGETAEQAATIGYVKWRELETKDISASTYDFIRAGSIEKGLDRFRDWYVEPLFDYLDETLEDGNVVLATLVRYKQKVEWYKRSEVLKHYEEDTSRGERRLKQHMFEFLFDQGLPFHVEPSSASGEPDVVSLDNSQHPFIGEIKIFDPERSKGPSYIKKAFYQAFRYCWDYNEPLAYLIVFNVSHKQLRVELPSDPDGVPRFEYNHKTIFLIVIDVHEHDGTASTLGMPTTVTITAAELVQEAEEAEKELHHPATPEGSQS